MVLLNFFRQHVRATQIVVIIILLAAAFAAGRYTLPAKVVTKTEVKTETKVVTQVKTEVVTKTVYVRVQAKNVHKEIDTIKKPDGTVETKTVYDDRSTTTTEASSQAVEQQTISKNKTRETETKTDKVVDNQKPQWHLGLRLGAGGEFGGRDGFNLKLGLGLQAERRILGPVFMGVWIEGFSGIGVVAPYVAPPYLVAGGLSVSMEF